MRREWNLMLCSVGELSEALANTINSEDVKNSHFTECNFCVVEGENLNRELEDIRRDASGWYGIKEIDAGFDSEDLIIACDYYGGGCACFISAWNGIETFEIRDSLLKALLKMLNIQEVAEANTRLVVEYIV